MEIKNITRDDDGRGAAHRVVALIIECEGCGRNHEELPFRLEKDEWKGACRQTGKALTASIDAAEIH